jgi:hypothetical protein
VNRIRIVMAPDQGDAGVVVTAAELHPEWLVLNYISQVPQDELARGLVDGQPKRFDVTDDLGTEYAVNGGSGGGEAQYVGWTSSLFLPCQARRSTCR